MSQPRGWRCTRPTGRALSVELTRAQRVRPALTYAVPHMAVQARIELARCYLALFDVAAARILLREIDEILLRRPRLGVFADQADSLRADLSHAQDSPVLGASALTTAELRLLPMLPTHLSFPEIAAQTVPLPPHHQVGGDVDLPEAGGLLPQPGSRPVP